MIILWKLLENWVPDCIPKYCLFFKETRKTFLFNKKKNAVDWAQLQHFFNIKSILDEGNSIPNLVFFVENMVKSEVSYSYASDV